MRSALLEAKSIRLRAKGQSVPLIVIAHRKKLKAKYDSKRVMPGNP